MQNRKGIACVLLALAGTAAGVGAQPTTWDGDAGDGFWISQQNWDTDTVPGASSEVTIPSDAGEVTIVLSDEACASLDCTSSLRLTSSTLAVSGVGNVTNMIFDGGGFLPTINTSGFFTISGSSSCATGSVMGSGEFANGGTFDAFSFTVDGNNGANASNTGTWNIPSGGGGLYLSNNGFFDNQGTLTLTPESVITESSGLFSNSGTVSRTGSGGSSTINSGFTQLAGTMSASGTGAAISLISDGWQIVGGTLEVSNSGRLSIGGTDVARTRTLGPSAITGDGTVDLFVGNATIDWINFTTTNVTSGGLNLYSGTYNLSGDITNNGLIIGRGTSFSGTGSFTNTAAGTLEIPLGNGLDFKMNATSSGAVEVRGSLFISNSAVFNQTFNLTGGEIQLYNQSAINTLTAGTPGVLRSGGTIQLMGDATGMVASSISTRLETLGGNLIQAFNGALTLDGGGSISNSIIRLKNDLSPAVLRFEGALPWSIDGSTSIFRSAGTTNADVNFGVINSAGPVVTIANGVEFEPTNGITMNIFSSDFAGAGTLKNSGLLKWFGGTLGCTMNNLKSMEIVPGIFGKTITADFINGFFDGFIVQSASITLDGGTITNQNDWTMEDGSSINPFGAGGTMHNAGDLIVLDPGGATHVIGVDFNNTGDVFVFGGHLVFTGDVLQLNQLDGTLSGGRWSAVTGSSITFPRSLVQLRGPARLEGGQAEFPDLPTLQSIDNAGAARLLDTAINGDLGISGGSTLEAAGKVTVNGTYTSTGGSTTTIEPGATVESTGTMEIGEVDSAADEINPIVVIARRGTPSPSIVTPLLDLYGAIRVAETGTGIVAMQGDLLMEPTARMHVTLLGTGHGTNTVDQLQITGFATIGGTLVVDASAADIAIGETRTVLTTTGGINGSFDQVQAIGLGAGESIETTVVGNTVNIAIVIACPADLNGDGSLNFFDVSAFLSAFATQDPAADFTGDGSFNFFDVSAFLSAFAAGCP
jgi:hypothetical protein